MSVDRKNVVFGRMQYVHNDYPDYVAMAVAPIDENMVAVVFHAGASWSEEMAVKFSDLTMRQK